MTASQGPLATLQAASRASGLTEAELAVHVTEGRLQPAGRDAQGRPLYRIDDIGLLGAPPERASVYASLQGEPELGPDASDRDRILASLPYFARRLVESDYAALTIMNSGGRIAQMYVSGMSQRQADALGDPPVGKGVLGLMGPQGAPIRLHNITDHRRSVGFPDGHPAMRSLLGVAIESHERHAANLYVANSPGRPHFTAEDQQLIESLAVHARIALEVDRLRLRESGLRQTAERSRREAEAARLRTETVLGVATVGVLVMDASGQTVISANEEIERILGMPLPEGTPISTVQNNTRLEDAIGRAVPAESRPLQLVVRTGQPHGPVDMFITSPEGERKPALVSAAPIKDSEGRLTEVVVAIQDTTVLMELEQAKRDFLSMVTHDLRTPVTTIKALLHDARTAVSDGRPAEHVLKGIEEEADYLNELVTNLLDMSRIEANADTLEFEQCHILDLVGDAVQRAVRSHYGRGRNIRVNVSPDLPMTFADPAQVGRVLDNLLSNALKYSETDIAVRCALDDGNSVVTRVEDYGRGIPAELVSNLFDKFFRVHHGRRAGREGSGLGLAVCKAIVEAHGGSIGVDSEEGNGSSFWFSLPAER